MARCGWVGVCVVKLLVRGRVVRGIVLALAVIQVVFGLVGMVGTYYVSVQVHAFPQVLDNAIASVNGLQGSVSGIQSNMSLLSANMYNIGVGIDVDILGLRPFRSVAQYFYNASTTLAQLSSNLQGVGQAAQQSAATLMQLRMVVALSLPYVFLYVYALNGMLLLNGVMWILYLSGH